MASSITSAAGALAMTVASNPQVQVALAHRRQISAIETVPMCGADRRCEIHDAPSQPQPTPPQNR
jgi:hypothetical protein